MASILAASVLRLPAQAAHLLDIDRNKLRRHIKKRQAAFGQSAAMRRAA